MNRAIILTVLILTGTCSLRSQDMSYQALRDSGKAVFYQQVQEREANFKPAWDLLQSALRLQPDDGEALYFAGYVLDKMQRDDANQMPGTRVQTTREISGYFERINRLSPKYRGERWVLDPYSKIGSLWGSLAFAYLNQNLSDSARWALKEGKRRGGFLEPLLEFNRQLLASCQPNSILLTAGDNITFPLLYLQGVERLRDDVTIIDQTMLHSHWYPGWLKRSGRVQMGYSREQLDTVTYQEWTPALITVTDPKGLQPAVSWMLKPTYQASYILRGDKITLDLFRNNLFKRPIHFAIDSDSTSNLYIYDYLVGDGLVSSLLLTVNDTSRKDVILPLTLGLYTLGNATKAELEVSDDLIGILNFYRYGIGREIDYLCYKGYFDEARGILNDMENKFPVTLLPYDTKEREDFVNGLRTKIEQRKY